MQGKVGSRIAALALLLPLVLLAPHAAEAQYTGAQSDQYAGSLPASSGGSDLSGTSALYNSSTATTTTGTGAAAGGVPLDGGGQILDGGGNGGGTYSGGGGNSSTGANGSVYSGSGGGAGNSSTIPAGLPPGTTANTTIGGTTYYQTPGGQDYIYNSNGQLVSVGNANGKGGGGGAGGGGAASPCNCTGAYAGLGTAFQQNAQGYQQQQLTNAQAVAAQVPVVSAAAQNNCLQTNFSQLGQMVSQTGSTNIGSMFQGVLTNIGNSLKNPACQAASSDINQLTSSLTGLTNLGQCIQMPGLPNFTIPGLSSLNLCSIIQKYLPVSGMSGGSSYSYQSYMSSGSGH